MREQKLVVTVSSRVLLNLDDSTRYLKRKVKKLSVAEIVNVVVASTVKSHSGLCSE